MLSVMPTPGAPRRRRSAGPCRRRARRARPSRCVRARRTRGCRRADRRSRPDRRRAGVRSSMPSSDSTLSSGRSSCRASTMKRCADQSPSSRNDHQSWAVGRRRPGARGAARRPGGDIGRNFVVGQAGRHGGGRYLAGIPTGLVNFSLPCPTSSPTSAPSRPSRSTSCARSRPSSSARCCCSPAARTRSSCSGSPRRRSGRRACRSRSCTSTPGTTSTRCSRSATPGSPSSAPASSSRRCRRRSTRPGRRGDRPVRQPQPAADGHAARRHRGAPLRRRVRRRPPRRGEGPGQGAGLQLPRRVRPVGPEEPAPRAVEPLQRAAPQGRAHPGVPDQQLDRARHLAVHRRGGHRDPRRSTTRTGARCSAATACCWPSRPT